ncbi:uncharacterized protein MONBRDRAFT_37341 [Monosiga brevicollis MX1]|uniref:Serine-threonine/tyrosine-protein kinase catalytic domain-containing protein n=1 Tax=Monosiga brevicollis TaxID=81824 RepID=A9V145_MONBE|nr:uncharacterized protein MONBRDRAFT_37341 [Monosiga brevicollis MX1]EDQ88743.1 predicted protein [Monosiga brevicollis MX1]|eukprot:XP_001746356.1 hypothetical protein [Monosiga brevicollis MX1]
MLSLEKFSLFLTDLELLDGFPWKSMPNLVYLQLQMNKSPVLLESTYLPRLEKLLQLILINRRSAFQYIGVDSMVTSLDMKNIRTFADSFIDDRVQRTLAIFESFDDHLSGYGQPQSCFLMWAFNELRQERYKRVMCFCHPPAEGVAGLVNASHCPYLQPIPCREDNSTFFFSTQLCNGVPNCPAGSDEQYCSGVISMKTANTLDCYAMMVLNVTNGTVVLSPMAEETPENRCVTGYGVMRDYDAVEAVFGTNIFRIMRNTLNGRLESMVNFLLVQDAMEVQLLSPTVVVDGTLFGEVGQPNQTMHAILVNDAQYLAQFKERYPGTAPISPTISTTRASSTSTAGTRARASHRESPARLVLGASVGAVAMVLAILLAVWFWRRGHNQAQASEQLVIGVMEAASKDYRARFPHLQAEPVQFYDQRQLQCRTLASTGNFSQVYQVAQGMSFLASAGIVHRDLAARNVLVFSAAPIHCKLADLGCAVSRVVAQTDYYKSSQINELPLRFVQCARQHRRFVVSLCIVR